MTRYVLAANYAEYHIWLSSQQPLAPGSLVTFVFDCNQLRGLGFSHEIVKIGDWTSNPIYQPQLEAVLINIDLAEAQGATVRYD